MTLYSLSQTISSAATNPGVSSHSLYTWLRERGVSHDARKAQKESTWCRRTLGCVSSYVALKRSATF